MAQVFKINGITLNYIASADWQTGGGDIGLDANIPQDAYIKHTWKTNVMPMSEFNSLYALEGERVDLTTTNQANKNGAYITYYGCDFQKITASHESINAASLTCEFLVRA